MNGTEQTSCTAKHSLQHLPQRSPDPAVEGHNTRKVVVPHFLQPRVLYFTQYPLLFQVTREAQKRTTPYKGTIIGVTCPTTSSKHSWTGVRARNNGARYTGHINHSDCFIHPDHSNL